MNSWKLTAPYQPKTLSPPVMVGRWDGSLNDVTLVSRAGFSSRFASGV